MSTLVWACSCDTPPPALVRLDESSAVFLGTVEHTRSGCHWFVRSSADESRTTFTVTEAFKGVSDGAPVEIVHATDGASCGIEFEEGESWLVFAFEDDEGQLVTNLCAGDAPEADAAADLAELRGE